MGTLIGVIVGLGALITGAIWYINRSEAKDAELWAAKARADAERARRLREEEEAAKLSAKRMEEFNEKASAARWSASRAAKLLNESSRSASD